MKRVFVWLFALMLAAGVVSAQTTVLSNDFSSGSLPAGWIAASGNWQVKDGKLYQLDAKETMAVLNIPCEQSGVMQYEFTIQYVDGFQDNYAGVGFHIMVSDPSKARSWGDGTSGLLWLTSDQAAYGPGVFAQAYASTGPTQMGLWPPRDIIKAGNNLPVPSSYMRPEALSVPIPVKVIIDTNAGEVRVGDPIDANLFYRFKADIPIKTGHYIALRTNSLAVSFDNLKVTKLQ